MYLYLSSNSDRLVKERLVAEHAVLDVELVVEAVVADVQEDPLVSLELAVDQVALNTKRQTNNSIKRHNIACLRV